MMFFALLVPFGLLAVLLGMERLERWTERGQARRRKPPAATGGAGAPPR
jgi:hypothetical protein